jgi:hypothetical protein
MFCRFLKAGSNQAILIDFSRFKNYKYWLSNITAGIIKSIISIIPS